MRRTVPPTAPEPYSVLWGPRGISTRAMSVILRFASRGVLSEYTDTSGASPPGVVELSPLGLTLSPRMVNCGNWLPLKPSLGACRPGTRVDRLWTSPAPDFCSSEPVTAEMLYG